MAHMSARARKRLPKSSYGEPGEKKYPMPDKRHAANAKARATQMAKRGKLSASAARKIKAKANQILGASRKKAA